MIADSPHVAARLASPTRCRKATPYRNGRRTKARYLASRRPGHEVRPVHADSNSGCKRLGNDVRCQVIPESRISDDNRKQSCREQTRISKPQPAIGLSDHGPLQKEEDSAQEQDRIKRLCIRIILSCSWALSSSFCNGPWSESPIAGWGLDMRVCSRQLCFLLSSLIRLSGITWQRTSFPNLLQPEFESACTALTSCPGRLLARYRAFVLLPFR